MWATLRKIWLRIHLWIAVVVALLGFAYFINQGLTFSDTLPTTPEEGNLLYVGTQFTLGRYQPYEDYSPWLSQMPLAYLLPGLVQHWFGPGMDLGRMVALGVGALALAGIWLVVRRNADLWWAAFAVLAVALNPTYVQAFSRVSTAGLVSMLVAWMLFFGLGAERQDRELMVAAFLAGLAGMSQQSMLWVLPLFVMYVFWQFDKRAGWLTLLAGLLPVIAVHIAFWPGILRVWANLLPQDLIPWLENYRTLSPGPFLPDGFSWLPIGTWIRDRQHLAWVGLRTFGEVIRVNFVVFFGLLTTLLLWPWLRKNRPSGRSLTKVFFNQHKQVVFLVVTFILLLAVSLWASNGRACQFDCLPQSVLSFYMFGLALVPIAAYGWREEIPFWKQILVVAAVALFLIALEFNYPTDYQDFRKDFVRNTLDLNVPTWQDGKLVRGSQQVWQVMEEKTSWDPDSVRAFILEKDLAVSLVRWIKVLGFLILVIPLAYALSEKFMLGSENYGTFMLTFILMVGMLFSWSHFLGGFLAEDTCKESVVASYERVGKRVDSLFPEGSQLYWGVDDVMPLLFLPGAEVFTPQLNGMYTFLEMDPADTDGLYRNGLWNSTLRDQWLEQADFILLEEQVFDADWQERVTEGQYELVFTSQRLAGCREQTPRFVVLEPVP